MVSNNKVIAMKPRVLAAMTVSPLAGLFLIKNVQMKECSYLIFDKNSLYAGFSLAKRRRKVVLIIFVHRNSSIQ